jgi:hypothetical protein
MNTGHQEERVIAAALARLPEWHPPEGFAERVAAVSAPDRLYWTPILLRGLRIAAGVSLASWLVAGMLYAGLLSLAEAGRLDVAAWMLGGGALMFAWRLAAPAWLRRA